MYKWSTEDLGVRGLTTSSLHASKGQEAKVRWSGLKVGEWSWCGTDTCHTFLQSQCNHAPLWSNNSPFFWYDRTNQAQTGVHHTHLTELPSLLVVLPLCLSTSSISQGKSVDIECHYSKENMVVTFDFRLMLDIYLAASRDSDNQSAAEANLLFLLHKQRLH